MQVVIDQKNNRLDSLFFSFMKLQKDQAKINYAERKQF